VAAVRRLAYPLQNPDAVRGGSVMDLLFSSWAGILSALVILFMFGMAIFLVTMFIKRSKNGSGD
jgi:hypothetical protein